MYLMFNDTIKDLFFFSRPLTHSMRRFDDPHLGTAVQDFVSFHCYVDGSVFHYYTLIKPSLKTRCILMVLKYFSTFQGCFLSPNLIRNHLKYSCPPSLNAL